MEEVDFTKSIFLGRGKDKQSSPGNMYFREFVECFRDRYESNPRNQKKHAITGVIRLLEMDGYRFLKYTGEDVPNTSSRTAVWVEGLLEEWEEAPEQEKYSKVAHAFRAVARHGKKSNQAVKAEKRASEHKKGIDEAYERLPQKNRQGQLSDETPQHVASTAPNPLSQLHERTEVTRRLVRIILGERESSTERGKGGTTS